MKINLGAASLNQIPLDWDHNLANIQNAIDKAEKKNIRILSLPELSVTGYGCEDYFYMEGLADDAISALSELLIPRGMVIAVGLPVRYNKRNYNGVAILSCDEQNDVIVHGIHLKQNLAMNGVHYESRWFEAWNKNQVSKLYIPFLNKDVPIGDLIFNINGISVGLEICEDAWVASRPGASLSGQGVDIIINPSASHFSIGKFSKRIDLIRSASASFGCAYVYSNLNGCESGRSVYDGGCVIASEGNILAKGKRLHFNDVEVLCATIDTQPNQVAQMLSSQKAEMIDDVKIITISVPTMKYSVIKKNLCSESVFDNESLFRSEDREHEESMRAVSLFLYDWMRKTKTNGFMLSLSGGADSSLCAIAVKYMVDYVISDFSKLSDTLPPHIDSLIQKKSLYDLPPNELSKYIVSKILHTLYQSSDNSGEKTFNSAKKLAEEIGARFSHWSISEEVKILEDKAEKLYGKPLTWEEDDVVRQNIQARVRSPGAWLPANKENKLLMTTSNMSEGPVGYCTLDGDTSGVIAPVAGISKSRIFKMLKWAEKTGPALDNNTRIKALKYVNSLTATAELRPDEQTDEKDLMPFEVLDSLRKEITIYRRRPISILCELEEKFGDKYTSQMLKEWIEKFYILFSRSQVKRDRLAPSPIIESDCLDPKTFARFPLLSSGLLREIQEMKII